MRTNSWQTGWVRNRPVCLRPLGDVAGRHVLDAVCGPGLYAEELISRGARVTGLDHSPRMVELSRRRVPTGNFRVHDLADRLDWLPDSSIDLALHNGLDVPSTGAPDS